MEETLEQKEQLKQWASERDAILSETYRSKVEQDSLISLNNQLTQSNKELEKSVKTLSDTKNSLTNEIAEMKKTVSDSARIKNENGQLVAIQKGLNENILQQQETVQLKTWVAQRDSISNEISSLITQKDKLTEDNKALAASKTEIQTSIDKSTGRLEELYKKESEYTKLISQELAAQISDKVQLELELDSLKKQIEILKPQKASLEVDISILKDTHERISTHVVDLEKVVATVTKMGIENTKQIKDFMEEVKKGTKDIIDLNSANVDKTNKLISDLPRFFFDLQKDALERKRLGKPKLK